MTTGMDPIQASLGLETRRQFFGRAALGLGQAALAGLLGPRALAGAAAQPAVLPGGGGLPGVPHYPGKAKRAIYLFMAGAPSQIDMLDYKPKLVEMDGMFEISREPSFMIELLPNCFSIWLSALSIALDRASLSSVMVFLSGKPTRVGLVSF